MSSKLSNEYRILDADSPVIESFTYVSHVAHIYDAYVIASDWLIKSELIRDKSVLNDTRLCVVWTSPNHWRDGYMYGRVTFDMPVENILNVSHFYWVEAMVEYNPTALRILVSDHVIEDDRITKFDPEKLGYPVYFRDDTWYRFSKYNYEFMIAKDISVDECDLIGFVKHHPQYCNRYGSQCRVLGESRLKATLQLVSYAIGTNDSDLAQLINPESDVMLGLNDALGQLLARLRKTCVGDIRRNSVVRAIVKNALLAIAHEQDDSCAKALGALPLTSAQGALRYLIKKTFGLNLSRDFSKVA